MFRLNLLLISLSLIVIGCDDNPMSVNQVYDFDVVIENNQVDNNGYYHLELESDSQTLQKLTAYTDNPTIQRVYWDADKTYQYDYNGVTFDVDIINHASYTNDDGEAFTMFGPHPNMVGDTVNVICYYNDEYEYFKTINIILE